MVCVGMAVRWLAATCPRLARQERVYVHAFAPSVASRETTRAPATRRDGMLSERIWFEKASCAASRSWLELRLMPVNKQERTYMILRDRIHSGSIAPLERLNIDALARELGVSPIPVREALRRLEAEGWVRFTPNVGAVVSPVDSTTWEQAMVSLAILEGAASAVAAERWHGNQSESRSRPRPVRRAGRG